MSINILLQVLENNFYYFHYKLYLNRVLTHKHNNYKVYTIYIQKVVL